MDELVATYSAQIRSMTTEQVVVQLQILSAQNIRAARGLLDDPNDAQEHLAAFAGALEGHPLRAVGAALVLSAWSAEDSLKRQGLL